MPQFLDLSGLKIYHSAVQNALNKKASKEELNTVNNTLTTKIDNVINGTTVVLKAANANNAAAATKATQDGNGNVIVDTYATKEEMNTANQNQDTNITNLDTRVTETENNISTLNTKVSTVEGDILITNTNVTNIVNGTTVVAKATNAVNAENATKAAQDGEGNVIADTYATTAEVEEMISNIDTGGSVSGDYLPLSGGTLTDDLTVQGIIYANAGIELSENIYIPKYTGLGIHGVAGSIGFNDGGEPCIVNTPGKRVINIGTDSLVGDYLCYTFPEKDGTVALTSDIPKYYIHTINVYNTSSTTYQIAFTINSTSATAYTKSTIYTAFPSKVFACSGYYGSNIAFKIAFTASGTARIVYGSGGSTVTTSIANFADTVIPMP